MNPNLKWAGLIINGDLVNTPNTQSDRSLPQVLEKGMKGYTVWPGLGNRLRQLCELNREGSYGKFKAGNVSKLQFRDSTWPAAV